MQVYGLCFSPDSQTLASGCDDQAARLWNTQTGELVQTIGGHDGSVKSVCFSPDGAKLACNTEHSVRLFTSSGMTEIISPSPSQISECKHQTAVPAVGQTVFEKNS